jgi:hypothetical protein
VCLYDLEQFGSAVIFNLLKTHPILLLGGLLLENPHYKSPDEVLAETQANAKRAGPMEKEAPGAES